MLTRKVHLVLGAAGARVIAYLGAIDELIKADIEFASISACSAGSLIGAMLATGMSSQELNERVLALDLRRLVSLPLMPRPFFFTAYLRWPFAKYDSAAVVELLDEAIGPNRTFADLPVPFATPAMDLLSRRLLVYATDTHPTMKVADAVRIAIGVPPLYAPHQTEGRVVLDAGVATQCPVWMVGRFDDEYPIVTLRTADDASTAPPKRIADFLRSVIEASGACQDLHLIEQIPRVRKIEIPVPDVGLLDIDCAQERKPFLIEAGRRVARHCLQQWGPDLTGAAERERHPVRSDATTHDDRAVATASAMMHGFANRLTKLSRRRLFISYSHRDAMWLDVIKSSLEPYADLKGLQVWDDTHIAPGDAWRRSIMDALSQTRVALLLVSPGFIASDFIREEELSYLLDATERLAVRVHWLLLSDLDGMPNPLSNRQAIFDPGRPLDRLQPTELVLALNEICGFLAREMNA